MVVKYSLSVLVLAAVALAKGSSSVNWGNTTGTSSDPFPTAVGNLGDMGYAAAPFRAQVDKVNTPKFDNNRWGIEMRWKPYNAQKDGATSDDIFRNVGAQSPYHPADDLFPETNKYLPVPDQCTIKQVHIVHRHGARNPTKLYEKPPGSFGQKVANLSKAGKLDVSGQLSFLKSWNYSLGQAVLTHQGAQELFDSGVRAYFDYAKLLEKYESKPVIRTTSQSRMIDSARYWTLGFFGWDAADKVNLEVLAEYDYQNNTLQPKQSCPNADNDDFQLGDKLVEQWQDIYLEAPRKRLQQYFHGAELTKDDISSMMIMCPYETVVLGYSQFCNLFTKEEWENLEYELDMDKQGSNGFMAPTGRAQGIGYVTEFLSRVQHRKFDGPQSSQNRTIDQQDQYFPLHQPLYADFTHDTVMIGILTAFNFTQFADWMDPTKPDPNRRFRTSRLTPFAARFFFEVLECDGTDYIRVKVNEALLPLDAGQGCEGRADGLCKLDDFVGHLEKYAYDASKFQTVCYGKNGTDFTVTGPVHSGAPES
ncbi:hypothetical protein MCUN1_000961 [Malassezia cuniculi]|uniref:Acid phosphatase n=1 Tax=Malassezia cuniculi TaxID=948313 RepID=A0AAF0JAB1_9BASI|nr:hypothetical protein MCUN1_000961 [Malassezia cuniculi]